MQHQILINVIIFVAYVLNLPLNTLRSHSRSQRAGKWSLIMAHDRRPIYRAPTYIAVPMLGPHQPRYIGLTLYFHFTSILVTSHLHPGPQIASQLHPGTISSSSRVKDVHLTSIQVHKIASQIQAATISNSPRFQDMSQLHAGPDSSESRFQYTCITSFYVPPDLHPGH